MSSKQDVDKQKFNIQLEEILKNLHKAKTGELDVDFMILETTKNYSGITDLYIKKRIKLIIKVLKLNLKFLEDDNIVVYKERDL